MTSTQHFPHSVSEQLNRNNKKQAIFGERSTISFLSMTQLKDQFKNHGVVHGIEKLLMNGKGPIRDTKPKKLI